MAKAERAAAEKQRDAAVDALTDAELSTIGALKDLDSERRKAVEQVANEKVAVANAVSEANEVSVAQVEQVRQELRNFQVQSATAVASAETHAKETGLLKEEIADLEEDRNEWKRKCEKARDETDLVRKRAREMLVEKEEELERALFNDGKATTTDGKISSIGRKAASGLTFLEEDDDDQQEQTEKKKNSSSKPPPREVTTTLPSSSESDFLYLKNILLQYLTTNERLVHERLVPVVTTLLKCSDEERAKVIAARVNMKPSSSGGSQPNTPTRSTGSGVRLFNAFFRT